MRATLPREKRWAEASGVALVVVAFSAIGASTRVGLVPTRAYGVLFVAVFAWLGLNQPSRTSLKILPIFLPAYVIPLLGVTPRFDPWGLAIVAATCVFVAEAIASGRSRASAAQGRADLAAQAFRTVATTSASLQRLDPHAVLDAVVDGVMALGYDAANLVIIDDASETFVLAHARGLAVELGTHRRPLGNGLSASVRASRQPVVVDDYASWDQALDFYRHAGVRAMIGVPVIADGHLTGVLVASTRAHRSIPASEQEPLQALAHVAGAALANVTQYQAEQLVAECRHTLP